MPTGWHFDRQGRRRYPPPRDYAQGLQPGGQPTVFAPPNCSARARVGCVVMLPRPARPKPAPGVRAALLPPACTLSSEPGCLRFPKPLARMGNELLGSDEAVLKFVGQSLALLPGGEPPEDTNAAVTVIVPMRNGGQLLVECLDSLRGKAAALDQLSILVIDNGSDHHETLDALEAEATRPRTRVLRLPEPFNWARLNNLAVQVATSEHQLFLNDDTRMLSVDWDRLLRRLLADPGVGAVGARLVYSDFTIQHESMLFGVEGLVAHEGVGAAMEDGGPGNRWQRLRRVGAVTGAFLACRRRAFEAAGGFDEHAFAVTCNDVDFCVRLRAAGLAVLYVPEIALAHHESTTRGIDNLDEAKQERAQFERNLLVQRWGSSLFVDPGFNPHWSRWTRPFSAIREPSEAEILAHMAATASPDPWHPTAR